MNESNYKTFAIIMASLGIVLLATGLMIYFMYPKMVSAGGPQGGKEITTTTEGTQQDDTFKPDEEATGTGS
jgi:hypothetical protein